MNRMLVTRSVLGCVIGLLALTQGAAGQSGACCGGEACKAVPISSVCEGTFIAGGSCEASVCRQPGLCCRGTTCTTNVLPADCSLPANEHIAGMVFIASSSEAPDQCGGADGCCASDFDHNGRTDEMDLFGYVRAWFDASEFAAVTSPRQPQVEDLFGFLTLWFAGC